MTDNRTTELREKLTERGVEHEARDGGTLHVTSWLASGVQWNYREIGDTHSLTMGNPWVGCTPEQAIAATLGSGTLTVEQVKRIHDVIEKHWHDLPAEYDMPEATALPECSYDWQAIADELNAELGNGTCEIIAQTWEDRGGDEEDTYEYELSCGHVVRMLDCEPLHNCPRCGKAVKR